MAPGCGDASMGTCLHRIGDDLRKMLAELRPSRGIQRLVMILAIIPCVMFAIIEVFLKA
jgi:hypothetical protein